MLIKEGKPPVAIQNRIENIWLRVQNEWRLYIISRLVKAHSRPNHSQKPIVLFNASTRLTGFSQNAAFNLLTSWGLQVVGNPVKHFVCRAGMSHCVLGTDPDDPYKSLPCKKCINLSKRILRSSDVTWFDFIPDPELIDAVKELNVDELSNFKWINRGIKIPLGKLVIPSLRWSLRRHHLEDDEATRYTLRSYLISAFNITERFLQYLDKVDPLVVVVFNGIMYPEAVVRWIALNRGIKVITHEVGFQPFSAFFSQGHATAYPMEIPDEFDLSEEQNSRLDEYLSRRRKGEFTMAGVKFWREIRGLDEVFLQKAKQFKQIVPVFTNVINDTSQVHANTVFSHMYEWLDDVVEVIREYDDTFFVIRAHPDEKRLGTRKHSRQPVSDWVEEHGIDKLPNVIFIDSNEPLSSYELILESKFVFVYNSSIGLEASLLNVPVLCGGKARYTQYPTVFFPQTPSEYQEMARKFLEAETIDIPSEFKRNARRVLYWQLFRSSLPFDRFVSAHPTPGYVQLRKFGWKDLLPENSPTMKVLCDGIVHGEPFILPE